MLVDTNAAFQFLNGRKEMRRLLNGQDLHISFVSEIELLSNPKLDDFERARTDLFISDTIVVPMDELLKLHVIGIRLKHRFAFADACIAATASMLRIPLVTGDREFLKARNDIHVIFLKPL